MADDKPDKSIGETLKDVFVGLVEVKVITVVGEVKAAVSDVDGRTSTVVTTGERADALITIFNLVDGDVTNVIAPALKDDAALRAFHTAQVDKSLSVLPANLEALVSLGKALLNELR